MRLIDADALRAAMYHEAFETDTDMQKWDGGCWIRYKMFENNIDKTPTIEPERKTGRWISGDMSGLSQCTACGEFIDEFQHETPYCPHCGAKMDMEDEK